MFDGALTSKDTLRMATLTQEVEELNETFGQPSTIDEFAKSLIYVGMSSCHGIPAHGNVAASAVFGQAMQNTEDESLVMYQSATAQLVEEEQKARSVQASVN